MDSYFTGRELTRPYTSGLYKKDLSFDEMKNLNSQITEDEKGSLFAKYYYEPMAELQLQMKAAVKAGALKPEQMYMPPQAGPILQSGSKGYPLNGYGVLENGVGYASMVIHQDGITDEMIRNYRDNFAVSLDPKIRTLFYKTWFPGKHLIHFEDAIIEDFGDLSFRIWIGMSIIWKNILDLKWKKSQRMIPIALQSPASAENVSASKIRQTVLIPAWFSIFVKRKMAVISVSIIGMV